MADKTATPVKSKNDLTTREIEVLAASWQCMNTQPEIDLVKLATLTGYTNPRSAGNMMAAIRKKLATLAEQSNAALIGPDAADISTPTKTKATPIKKGSGGARKRKADAEGDAADGAAPAPVKKSRTPRKKKSPAVVPQDDSDKENGDEVKVKEKSEDAAASVDDNALQQDDGNAMDEGEV